MAGGCEQASRRVERHRPHRTGVAFEVADQRAAVLIDSGVPESDRVVVATGCEHAPRPVERHRPHPTGVAFEAADQRASSGVPKADRVVVATGCEQAPSRIERHRQHPTGVAFEDDNAAGSDSWLARRHCAEGGFDCVEHSRRAAGHVDLFT